MSKSNSFDKNVNVFSTPQNLKAWAHSLADACGSVLINKPPNNSRIDNLISKFVNDYNANMQQYVSEEE